MAPEKIRYDCKVCGPNEPHRHASASLGPGWFRCIRCDRQHFDSVVAAKDAEESSRTTSPLPGEIEEEEKEATMDTSKLRVEARVHVLKTWPEFFQASASGHKRFEVRKDDRGFLVNDILVLMEYIPDTKRYTGNSLVLVVTYIMKGGQIGIDENFVVMGVHPDLDYLSDEMAVIGQ